MMKNLLWIFLFFAAVPLHAQNEDFVFEDRIYVDYIASVKFNIDGLSLSYPVIDLNSSAPLLLRFDDLDGGVRNYTYTIIHCDSDWTPSQLNEMEYLQGFAGESIRDYRFSFKTVFNFTHYWVQLPNQDMRWTKSGNYLLIVYEDEGQKIPVITRRFMVVDPIVKISPQLVRPAKVSKSRTHQEVDFVVDHEQLDIRTPLTEVKATVLQNGRWGTAIQNVQPAFTRYRQLIFDHQDKIVFPAGKEFRYFDIRSLRSRSENIATIERYKDRTDVILYKDESRARQSYSFIEDINGKFIIETFEGSDFDLSSDYASVFFSLATEEPYQDYDIYIVGDVTAWQLRDEFQMVYNNSLNAYVAKPLLKQGFYNFGYAAVPKNAEKAVPDFSLIEGDWYQTENEYVILIYYRPFGSRYDQLIGARTFSSTPR